jgi:Flp pilus assembly protein TadG
MVEFAISAPILLMLMIGVAEFGQALWQYNKLTKSVEDGARYVAGRALNGSTGLVSLTAALQAEGRNLVAHGNVFGAGPAVLPGLTSGNVTVANGGVGDITVTAAYPYTPIFGFVPKFFYGPSANASGITLTAAVTMRAL